MKELLSGSLLSLPLVFAASAVGAFTIAPSDDVTVRPGQGNLDESGLFGLLVKEGGSASFIEFTLGDGVASVATLHLHNHWSNASAPVSYDVTVRGDVHDFDETTLTHATQPDDSGWTVVVASFHVDDAPRAYALDVTDFYNAHLGETVTFALRNAGGSGDGPIFDDREGTGGHMEGPRIEVTPADGPPPPGPAVGGGWLAHFYKPGGEVTGFPDLDALEPRGAAIVPSIDVEPTGGQFVPWGLEFVDDFAARYEGVITLPEGITTFHLASDDGSRLLVDGVLVVEDLAGGFAAVAGDVLFDAGEHCIVVEYFERDGPTGLRVEYTPPGGARRVVPPDVMLPDACATGGVRVPRWRLLEISLTASSAPANPFTAIRLTAQVTAPDGRLVTVEGYHDGDGRGGQQGNIWKLRLAPDEVGRWSWATNSNDPALDGRSGEFECLPSDAPGPVVAAGRHFTRARGEPVYFLDRAAPALEEFSHTLLAEQITAANRQNMIRRHRDFHRANKMNVYVANRGDYGGIATTPWVGSSSSNDKSRFDLVRWRMYEEVVAQLRDEGMVAELWFFADDSGFGGLPDADRQRLIAYAMARLSAYSHTMFVLALEWQEGWSASEVRAHGTFIQDHNPWRRLVSVHGTTGNFAFPADGWVDFMATQSGNSIDPAGNNAHTIANRSLAARPLIVEGFGILDTDVDRRLRGNLWAAFCGGAAGSGTGSDLRALRGFIEGAGVPFWRMAPDNALASRGFVLAERGKEYVVYAADGREFTLRLEAGAYEARWFDPRSAGDLSAFTSAVGVAGGTRSFSPPDGNDWVLHVTLPAGPADVFIRGDGNGDGRIDLSDSVFLLVALFRGGPPAECEKAADANDDGAVNLADPLHVLDYLFLEGPRPASPYPDCGADGSDDMLSCESYGPCGAGAADPAAR